MFCVFYRKLKLQNLGSFLIFIWINWLKITKRSQICKTNILISFIIEHFKIYQCFSINYSSIEVVLIEVDSLSMLDSIIIWLSSMVDKGCFFCRTLQLVWTWGVFVYTMYTSMHSSVRQCIHKTIAFFS